MKSNKFRLIAALVFGAVLVVVYFVMTAGSSDPAQQQVQPTQQQQPQQPQQPDYSIH